MRNRQALSFQCIQIIWAVGITGENYRVIFIDVCSNILRSHLCGFRTERPCYEIVLHINHN